MSSIAYKLELFTNVFVFSKVHYIHTNMDSTRQLADFPEVTADGRYYYNALIVPGSKETLFDISNKMNEYLVHRYGWNTRNHWPPESVRLCPGSWGAESNISRIGEALNYYNSTSSTYEIAVAMHAGWSKCLLYWTAFEPWKRPNSRYRAPGKRISSRGKYKRAQTAFDDLDDYQKDLYWQMAAFLRLYYLDR